MELGGPLSPEALGSLPTLPKIKAGTVDEWDAPYVFSRGIIQCNVSFIPY